MENNNTTNQGTGFKYRRTSKSPSLQTRQKLSNALKGKTKSPETRERIAAGLRQYWNTPENFPDDNQTEYDGPILD